VAHHALVLTAPISLPEDLAEDLRQLGMEGLWELAPGKWRAYFASCDVDLPKSLEDRYANLRAVWEEEDKVDWAARYQSSLRPIPVGRRFVILPAPDLHNPWPERTALQLVPGMAFGTGEHFTTSSCLAVLECLSRVPSSVLDVGCGTGILASAACKVGSVSVTACDVDPVACRVAGETAVVNGVGYRILCGSADALAGSFDLVFANILAETLVEIMPVLCDRLGPEGFLIGSGILLSKGQFVQDAAAAAGLRVIHMRTDGEWWTFLWRRE
jgi:ribosomal protein L11 methyltransferase